MYSVSLISSGRDSFSSILLVEDCLIVFPVGGGVLDWWLEAGRVGVRLRVVVAVGAAV